MTLNPFSFGLAWNVFLNIPPVRSIVIKFLVSIDLQTFEDVWHHFGGNGSGTVLTMPVSGGASCSGLPLPTDTRRVPPCQCVRNLAHPLQVILQRPINKANMVLSSRLLRSNLNDLVSATQQCLCHHTTNLHPSRYSQVNPNQVLTELVFSKFY